MEYTKKPITIKAVKWNGEDVIEPSVWFSAAIDNGCIRIEGNCVKIKTLEGEMTALPGDYIIKGVKGEIYPCKPDIFEASYSEGNVSDMSDGFHTFKEYETFKTLYNAAFFNCIVGKYKVCKSIYHDDGKKPFNGGYFVVYAELPTGQISNHYELKYWNLFNIPIVDKAPKWDGHTSFDVMSRMLGFVQNPSNFMDEVITPWKAIEMINDFHVMRRSAWDKDLVVFRQVPASIQSDIIPNMQSVPKEAKDIIMSSASHIEYKNQLLMYNMNTGEANSWNPTASDLMTCDWESFVRF